MASKKSLRQMATMKALYLDKKTMSYRTSPGFLILDGDEDGYVADYITYDKDDGGWQCEYTSGYIERNIRDTAAQFRVFKQV